MCPKCVFEIGLNEMDMGQKMVPSCCLYLTHPKGTPASTAYKLNIHCLPEAVETTHLTPLRLARYKVSPPPVLPKMLKTSYFLQKLAKHLSPYPKPLFLMTPETVIVTIFSVVYPSLTTAY